MAVATRQGRRDTRCHGDGRYLPRRRPGLTVNHKNIPRRGWAELPGSGTLVILTGWPGSGGGGHGLTSLTGDS